MSYDLRFTPSRVDGAESVEAVAIYPDRLELGTTQGVVTHYFADIAHWPTPSPLWRLAKRIGLRPKWLPVADRDWFHDPPDMFFRFYTQPAVTVYMPVDESKEPYSESYFVRIQQILGAGGFSTFDLG